MPTYVCKTINITADSGSYEFKYYQDYQLSEVSFTHDLAVDDKYGKIVLWRKLDNKPIPARLLVLWDAYEKA